MKVKSESEFAQSCLTPSDPMDCSLLGSSIFQARVLEWVATAFCEKNGIDELISKAETVTYVDNTFMVSKGEGGWDKWETGIDIYTYIT